MKRYKLIGDTVRLPRRYMKDTRQILRVYNPPQFVRIETRVGRAGLGDCIP
jgi:hypothetical protein